MLPFQSPTSEGDPNANGWVKLAKATCSAFAQGIELIRLEVTAAVSGIAKAIHINTIIVEDSVNFIFQTAKLTAGTIITLPNYRETTLIRLTANLTGSSISIFLPLAPVLNQKIKVIPKFNLAVTFKGSGGGIARPVANAPTVIAKGANATAFYTGTAQGWFFG